MRNATVVGSGVLSPSTRSLPANPFVVYPTIYLCTKHGLADAIDEAI